MVRTTAILALNLTWHLSLMMMMITNRIIDVTGRVVGDFNSWITITIIFVGMIRVLSGCCCCRWNMAG